VIAEAAPTPALSYCKIYEKCDGVINFTASAQFAGVQRHPVGFRYIAELIKIKKDKVAIGGEESVGLSIAATFRRKMAFSPDCSALTRWRAAGNR
jgi:phosphomannomutase